MIDISIIIPSYKPADYIFECLSSIKNQTLCKNRFEIIIVLNGCLDPYYTKIYEYIIDKEMNSNTILLQTDISGVSNARNIGLDKAQGKYIVFIDDDDYISPQYLSGLLEKADDFTISLSNAKAFYDKSNKIMENYYMKETYNKIKNKNHISLFEARALFNVIYMKLIPKNIIENIRFNDNFRIGEDSLFMYEISKNIKNISISEPSSEYFRRYREGSAVTNKRNYNQIWNNSYYLFKAFLKIWLKNPFKYNFMFTVSRLLACMKNLISDIKFQKNTFA